MDFLTNTSSASDIQKHLEACDKNFLHELTRKTNIELYSFKIKNFALCIEAWNSEQLVGLLAIYCNKLEYAFITNMSVLPEWQGKGISFHLMNNCIQHKNIQESKLIILQVKKTNFKAINFYKKFNFEKEKEDNTHLIMRLKLG
ncbi:GNAT family N-acetyltransferase [Actimicrobium antarcticum]|uniref:N-acetyltransferase domain-containing protein n=1 Tax=Actimicrobium antarcticum TaxID=1051899 RepID=A0ABP7SRL2_9BURK